jgi:hypothetical protein
MNRVLEAVCSLPFWHLCFHKLMCIFQGDKIVGGRILDRKLYNSVQVSFFDAGDRTFSTSLYCSDNEIPPSRKTSCKSRLSSHPNFATDWDVSLKAFMNYAKYDTVFLVLNFGWKIHIEIRLTKQKWRDCYFDLLIHLGNIEMADFFDKLRRSCGRLWNSTNRVNSQF